VQLIAILLITVSILTFLSGATVMLGSSKGDRIRSLWFFIATIFATVWMVSISLFLIAKPEWNGLVDWHVKWTYISAIFIDVALLAYISWKKKFGKIVTFIFLIAGIVLSAFFARNPSLLYTGINLTPAGNSLVTNIGPFYFTYIGFFCCLVPTVILTLLKQIIDTRSSRTHKSDIVLLIGFMISGTMSLIFNLILPLWTWKYIWLGPLAISTTIIAFYYTILRYRALSLNSRWLKILSYVVIITSFAVIYMVVFSIIFAVMFRGSTPSTEVIILNFIMTLFFLLLMPATSELTNFIRSLISDQDTGKENKVKTIAKKDNADR
jgi:hypothetical protein